jgi:hypothetical protein
MNNRKSLNLVFMLLVGASLLLRIGDPVLPMITND